MRRVDARDTADVALWLGGLILCGFALLLPLYHALSGNDERSSSGRSVPLSTQGGGQSMPARFELLYSENQRGLMLFDGYIYLLRQGDMLPDGSRFGSANSLEGEGAVEKQERTGGDEIS
jgi:hypothetical protein